ncbi:MAG: LL-diaminopimelate aminotransferase [Armatimonadetes bacterium]|nr:LL-diaminopimelate aminotransferase [Armatimonadota bacterium]
MRSAKRLEKIPPYLFSEIARAKAKALAEGKDLVDLGIGDPDQPTPQPIIDRLCRAASTPVTHRYDETPWGWQEFIEAAAAWMKRRFGVEVDPGGEILLLIGSKEGLAHLSWAYIDPGDISLVPDPAYTVYKISTMLAGGAPYIMPLKEERGFLPDLAAIPSDVARAAKLMFLNYPNNPTGAVASQEFFDEVVAFAREYDIVVCHDAAYTEVAYDGYKAPSFLASRGAKEIGIEMHSMSKTFNMTGWRIGFAAGNRDVVKALNAIKSNVDSKQFPAIDIASAYGLLHQDELENALTLYQRRRDILVDGLNAVGWKVTKPKASLYVWTRIPEGHTSIDFAKRLLEEAGVLAVPGIGYGQYGEGYIRMSLTVSGDQNGERLQEAVNRIAKLG